ncbi:hypothetical protein EVG20_g6931 [Dentipellis fragilis]|uniref:Xylose isomerase-like TIM barrel domain-containing protein n=1 Tax=Dentipellis fragilis TaxID=205917 RepID=A0A4Y9YJI0_9AGAM|nr:hypothetical protein EVG20_g6931 [Dentipellis fragilis]
MVSTRSRSSRSAAEGDNEHPRPAKRVKITRETAPVEGAAEAPTPDTSAPAPRPKEGQSQSIHQRCGAAPGGLPRAHRDALQGWRTRLCCGRRAACRRERREAGANGMDGSAGAFALFLKSQRKWTGPALTEESIDKFKRWMSVLGYESGHVLPHGSYLVNLGNPDAEKREKSYECFLDELKRCEQLGLTLYNLHPGSSVGACSTEDAITFIAECVNRAHKETKSVVVVLENMAGAGNIVGGKFEHLAGIIEKVKDKERVGVCLDTCAFYLLSPSLFYELMMFVVDEGHTYAAGYDIRSQEGWNATMDEFDRIVGVKYLRGMHLNDSKAPLGSKKDRHENVGLGTLSLQAFAHVLSDPRTRGIPLILETPMHGGEGMWPSEVRALHMLAQAGGDAGDALKGSEKVIKDAAKMCGWTKGEVKAKAKPKAKAKATKKRKKGEDEEDEEDEDDRDGCC